MFLLFKGAMHEASLKAISALWKSQSITSTGLPILVKDFTPIPTVPEIILTEIDQLKLRHLLHHFEVRILESDCCPEQARLLCTQTPEVSKGLFSPVDLESGSMRPHLISILNEALTTFSER